MPSTWCCVPNCSNIGGHQFPKDEELREKWLAAINRDGFQPSKHSVVCKKHFTPDQFSNRNSNGFPPAIQRLRKGSVPRLFNQTQKKKTLQYPWKLNKISKAEVKEEVNDNESSMNIDSEIRVKFEIEDPDVIATPPMKIDINCPGVLTKFEATSADLSHLKIKLEP